MMDQDTRAKTLTIETTFDDSHVEYSTAYVVESAEDLEALFNLSGN